jgi:hypothetical protein
MTQYILGYIYIMINEPAVFGCLQNGERRKWPNTYWDIYIYIYIYIYIFFKYEIIKFKNLNILGSI